MNILGISGFYHDSAAAIVQNGRVIAAAQEERFTRVKNDPSFPKNAIRYCLQHSGFTIEDLDAIVFYDKPLLKFERLLETYYSFVPKGFSSFLLAMPTWVNEKMFLKKIIRDELKELGMGVFNKEKIRLLFPEHHLSHASSAFYPSPFESAAILTIDGVGEWATATICHGTGNKIKILKELPFPHSLGLLYSAFTYFCGFKVNSGEYKLMGLAPYGNPESEEVKRYIELIKTHLVDIKEDGSIFLHQQYFRYATGFKMINESKWKELFGFPKRREEDHLDQKYCDIALAIQKITEEIVINMAKEAKRLTNSEYLCMAGGVALNCVANGQLREQKIFKDIFIQPAAGDAGGALGAALAAHYIYFDTERRVDVKDSMKGTFLGPEFSDYEIKEAVKKFKASYTFFDDQDKLYHHAAKLIADGKIIGWFQGRMEFGPRALGARSIIADARNPDMQKKLNLYIKYREGFRPFAPAVLSEDVNEYFESADESSYMLFVSLVKKNRLISLPKDYSQMQMMDKLYFQRSDVPAITHIDNTARIQTVSKEENESFWKLITEFKKITGCSLVINTSFNVRGEPMVCTPEDAYKGFMGTEMDCLVMGNFLFEKSKQPEWKEKDNWREKIKRD